MCRWLAYSGSPILLEDIVYKPSHSLIEQSLHAKLGVETTNGDGFGIGWYGHRSTPAVFRDVGPAWSNRNLRELTSHIRSRMFFAHIRASTGSATQQTNCHPFRYGRWLWMHNGMIDGFSAIRRELALAVAPALFPSIEGSTDSEVMFFLALGLGLAEDPPGAVARMAGLVEEVGWRHGVEHPVQMTVAVCDGTRMWAFRYSTEHRSRSLFHSTDIEGLKELYPDSPLVRRASEEARLVVSEPLGDVPGAWNEVPESSYAVVEHGRYEIRPFAPARVPVPAVGA
ncbi:class II glutamine amidotransferase [Streptacidiphilus sp. ASG 303]|uniref:class II glutamine amidotransferase n=1 Tax=Streptacidiphilus sp. ASG 303 TaxID=2896847 RepID=UPI001E3DD39F|nr:class II glutamine amidotransferase [Streptacidiphilus sp. ASG 303]MCD0483967.1 class II glutamine amidotransferase [Streptacidiphilus sp. ASG 303]